VSPYPCPCPRVTRARGNMLSRSRQTSFPAKALTPCADLPAISTCSQPLCALFRPQIPVRARSITSLPAQPVMAAIKRPGLALMWRIFVGNGPAQPSWPNDVLCAGSHLLIRPEALHAFRHLRDQVSRHPEKCGIVIRQPRFADLPFQRRRRT